MPNSYDEIIYPSIPRAQSHPDHLATIAALFGMTAVPLDRCRVLELGCGDGSNLIPMAFDSPRSAFIGVDLAQKPITAARDFVSRCELANIEFHQLDLSDWTAAGKFDYIIAHGLYSWAPPAVREKILSVCGAALSPNGIAYISYNVLPGCHFRNFVRDLLQFHTKDLGSATEKVAGIQAIARTMLEHLGDTPHHLAMKSEFETLLERPREAAFHDELSPFNTPFYLLDFTQTAESHGLQYLSDTDLQRDDVRNLPLKVEGWLEQRQYCDFIAARRFRETLLCRRDIQLSRTIDSAPLSRLHIASNVEPEPEQPNGEQTFNLSKGRSLTTNDPVVKELLCALAEKWPAMLPASDFPVAAKSALMLNLFQMGAVMLRSRPPALACSVSDYPISSALARAQLSSGSSTVTNLLHTNVELKDAISRTMLQLLDGARNRDAILRDLKRTVQPGVLGPTIENGRSLTRAEINGLIEDGLDASLRSMVQLCLLSR